MGLCEGISFCAATNSLRRAKIFSRMFAEPLFDSGLMRKEVSAVNSENQKNLNSDNWRQNQVLKTLAHKESPCSHFGTGSQETLLKHGIDTLSEKLNDYYREHYLPNKMKLVVSGKAFVYAASSSLDDIQDNVASFFSDVRSDTDGNINGYTYAENNNTISKLPFTKDNLVISTVFNIRVKWSGIRSSPPHWSLT